MKISPLEIRQKTFEKNFRGYDKEEVDAYLLSLSQEWERVMDESKELRTKVANAEREVQKLREVETTLYKTLKTAEDTGANIVGQANKSAELLIKESQMNAEAMMSDARTKAKNLFEEAEEKVRNILHQAQSKVNDLVIEIKSLESQKQNMVHELKQLGQGLVDRANMAATSTQIPDFNKLLSREENMFSSPKETVTAQAPRKEIVLEIQKTEEPTNDFNPSSPENGRSIQEEQEKKEEDKEEIKEIKKISIEEFAFPVVKENKETLSFFDQI